MIPEGFLQRVRVQLGDEYPAFLESLERPRAVGLRLNPLKTDSFPHLPFGLTPVPWAKNGYYYDPDTRPGLHPWHEAGLYYLQEASAMAPAPLLDPQPGERVLDLCAAPGGKSTQLAAAMGGRGLLVVNEIHPQRAKILSRNIERMAVRNALVLNESPQRLAKAFPGFFHRILVDAPCSGEGMFRKEAAAVTDWSQETVEMCAARQDQIVDEAAKMLLPGGRLVYSTCTFAPEENEGTISRFLKAHPEFSVEAVHIPWFAPGDPTRIPDPAPGLEGTFRLWPHRLRGEGHYAAVLQKDGGECGAISTQNGEKLPSLWSDFAKQTGILLPEGKLISFGSTLYWAPEELPELKGLKVLRPGLELGEVIKNRFQPGHALALWLKTAAQTADFPPDSPEIAKYLHGEVLPGPGSGWTLVTAGGLSLGWAKASNGQLKNHYPKGLRTLNR